MAFDNSSTNAVLSASPEPTPRRCEPQFSWPHLEKSYVVRKLSISEAEIYSFSIIGQRMKILQLLIFLPENLKKYRSTELYDAPLEGSTIFLYRSSTSRTPLDSSGLAELKYAFSSRTGRNTENYGARTFFN